jgi:hypothetical protein
MLTGIRKRLVASKMLIVELGDRHPDFMDIESVPVPAVRLRKHILQTGYTEVHIDAITVFRAHSP